jgi:hypothetical protein
MTPLTQHPFDGSLNSEITTGAAAGTLAKHPDYSGTLVQTGGGRAYQAAASTEARYVCGPVPGSADYYIEAVFERRGFTSAGHWRPRLLVRAGSTANDKSGYLLKYRGEDGGWRLYRVSTGGTETEIGSGLVAQTFFQNTPATARLTIEGSHVFATIDGVSPAALDATDTTITAVGQPALGWLQDSTNAPGDGVEINAVVVEGDLAASEPETLTEHLFDGSLDAEITTGAAAGTLSKHPDYSGTLKQTGDGRAYQAEASTEARYLCDPVPGTADYFVEAVFERRGFVSAGHWRPRLLVRAGSTANDKSGYLLKYRGEDGGWRLCRVSAAGTETEIGSGLVTQTFFQNTPATARLTVAGSHVFATIGGVNPAALDATDTTITAVGRAALGWLQDSTNAPGNGVEINAVTVVGVVDEGEEDGSYATLPFDLPLGCTHSTANNLVTGPQTDGTVALRDTMPDWTEPTGSNAAVVTVATTGTDLQRGTALQAALNNAARNTVILVPAGFTYDMGGAVLTLPAKAPTATPWIWLVADTIYHGTFPRAAGQRVLTGDASAMPTIKGSNRLGVINTVAGNADCSNYWMAGLDVISTAEDPNYGGAGDLLQFAIMLGVFRGSQVSLATTPGHFGVDRCLVHSTSVIQGQGGVGLFCRHAVLRDSRSYSWRSSVTKTDSQAVACLNGPGPFRITNNYLEANGENFMMGGAGDPSHQDLMPQNIWFDKNWCRKPMEWNPHHPSHVPAPASNCKNQVESKGSWRVLIEGNVFENCWREGQNGAVFQIWNCPVPTAPDGTPGSLAWAKCQDWHIRYNSFINCNAGISMRASGTEMHAGTIPTQRIYIAHNIGKGWHTPTLNGGPDISYFFKPDAPDSADLHLDHIQLVHNTLVQASASRTNMKWLDLNGTPAGGGKHTNIVIKDNVLGNADYLIKSNAGDNAAGLAAHCDGAVWDYNVCIDPFNVAAFMPGLNNQYITDINGVGFSSVPAENYALVSGPFLGDGSDGTDPGANHADVAAFTSGVAV